MGTRSQTRILCAAALLAMFTVTVGMHLAHPLLHNGRCGCGHGAARPCHHADHDAHAAPACGHASDEASCVHDHLAELALSEAHALGHACPVCQFLKTVKSPRVAVADPLPGFADGPLESVCPTRRAATRHGLMLHQVARPPPPSCRA